MWLKSKLRRYLEETKQLNEDYYIRQRELEADSREQDVELKEQRLHALELQLKKREADIADREKAVQDKINNLAAYATEKGRRLILSEKAAFEHKVAQMEDYINALRKTEAAIFDWLDRMEDKEQDVYDEIQAKAQRFAQYGRELNGIEFERQMAELLSKNGFSDIQITKASGDYGADITATKDEIKYVVQCKYYASAVGIKAVQESYSAKDYYNAHVAVVATNNVFTKAASTLAEQLNVILWDCEDIQRMKNQ